MLRADISFKQQLSSYPTSTGFQKRSLDDRVKSQHYRIYNQFQRVIPKRRTKVKSRHNDQRQYACIMNIKKMRANKLKLINQFINSDFYKGQIQEQQQVRVQERQDEDDVNNQMQVEEHSFIRGKEFGGQVFDESDFNQFEKALLISSKTKSRIERQYEEKNQDSESAYQMQYSQRSFNKDREYSKSKSSKRKKFR